MVLGKLEKTRLQPIISGGGMYTLTSSLTIGFG